MKPIGLLDQKKCWDFADLWAFKTSQMGHANSGQRAARRNMKILVRSLKRSEKQNWKQQLGVNG